MQYGREGFRDFYFETYKDLYRYVNRMDGIQGMEEDVVQEVYILAYVKWDVVYRHPKPMAWLYVTANYLVKNLRRLTKNRALSLELFNDTRNISVLEADFGKVEWRLALHKILSEKDWEILWKYCVEGYEIAELARLMKSSENSIRMQISRIRRKIKRQLS